MTACVKNYTIAYIKNYEAVCVIFYAGCSVSGGGGNNHLHPKFASNTIINS